MGRAGWVAVGAAAAVAVGPGGYAWSSDAEQSAQSESAASSAQPIRAGLSKDGRRYLTGRGSFRGPTSYTIRVRGRRIVADGTYRLRIRLGGQRLSKRVTVHP